MNTNIRWMYIWYFRKFATAEQIWDLLDLSVESVCDYILEIWKEIYEQNSENSLNIHSKWLKSSEINYWIFS